MSDFNAKVIEEFRSNAGKVGGWFADKDVLLMHNTGAKSGQKRLAPLVYRREGERIFVFASKGGSDSNPDWYHNIKANPGVHVEIGTDAYDATAVEIIGDERDEIYGRQSADIKQFGDYQEGTERIIPVIEIVRS